MIFMSMAMTFNYVLIMLLLQKYLSILSFYELKIPGLPPYASNVISFVILFISPCIIVNYLLIFRNKRYERLLKKYPYYQGKLFLGYFLISMLLPIILLWIGIIFFR